MIAAARKCLHLLAAQNPAYRPVRQFSKLFIFFLRSIRSCVEWPTQFCASDLQSTLTGSRQTRDSGESVKSRVKTQDLLNSLGFHNGQVHRVASGHADKTHYYFLCALRGL